MALSALADSTGKRRCIYPLFHQHFANSTSLGESGPIEINFWMELTRMWSGLDDAVGSCMFPYVRFLARDGEVRLERWTRVSRTSGTIVDFTTNVTSMLIPLRGMSPRVRVEVGPSSSWRLVDVGSICPWKLSQQNTTREVDFCGEVQREVGVHRPSTGQWLVFVFATRAKIKP